MIPKKYRKELDRIIQRYQQGTATTEESRFIEDYYNAFDNNPNISEQLTEEEKEQWKQTLLAKIHEHIAQGERAPVIPLYRRTTFKWVAAASIIVIISLSVVISNQWSRKASGPIGEKSPSHDVSAPTNTRAVITLADGRKVYLDSVSNGTIAQENNVNVIKNENGVISYEFNREDAKSQGEIAYNTLSNPRGSKVISLTLSDGTKVWLNSESSLKYPIAFNGNSREVEITGEAYLEVKHDAKQPFKVHLPNGSIVEDIGTSFNINSYPDEGGIKTTLIEGSVKVVGDAALNTNNGKVLKPGEQAMIMPQTRVIRVQNNIDMDEVLAWKNGRFYYDGVNIKSIMKEISRWYNVEIEYKDDINYSFVAKISRDVPVSQLLKIIELTDLVHFKIEGNKVIVYK